MASAHIERMMKGLMKNPMRIFRKLLCPVKNFLLCGCIGWCWEILVTALSRFADKNFDRKLRGETSLWMFPIYGMGVLFLPLARLLKRQKLWFRGLVYTILIFMTEYVTGIWLTRRKLCPWNYSHARWNVRGVIRLDYAPGWFLLGLLYENMLKKRKGKGDDERKRIK